MRVLVATSLVVMFALGLGLMPAPARAQEAEALRKELEQMRKQFENIQQQYQKAIETMNERLQRLESRPQPVAAPPATSPSVAMQGPSVGQFQSTQPSALDLLRPRQPFGLYTQRGSGQLLFDMGVTGDFIGNITQHNVDKARAGTFPNRENRFFPREIELSIFGQIDPFARAEVRIEGSEEKAGQETKISLAEANLTLLTLPLGTQLKMGQMRARYGLTNVIHEHDLPFIDRPDVYRFFFGEDGLVEKGAELTWVSPFPFYLEALFGVFNGDNDTAFGWRKLNQPLVTGRVRTFFELSDTSAIQLGLSVADGTTSRGLQSTLPGFDVKFKYRPDGWLHPLLTLAGEGIYSIRKTMVGGTDPDMPLQNRLRERFGWYGHAELQPFRRWAGGFRYDSTQYPENSGHQWAIEPYLSLMPSEFLRFRLGYKHTERDHRDGFQNNGATARIVDEMLLQATFILGAHPAHPF